MSQAQKTKSADSVGRARGFHIFLRALVCHLFLRGANSELRGRSQVTGPSRKFPEEQAEH